MTSQSRLSYLYSSPPQPFNYTTLPRVVKNNAQTRPDQEIFVIRRLDGSRSSLTNINLYHQGLQLARYLVSKGIQKGDIVALVGPNTLEMAVGHVGIMCAGAVVFNVHIETTTANNVHETFRLTSTKLIVVDSGENDELLPAIKALLKHSNSQNEQEKRNEHVQVLLLRTAALDGYHDVPTFKSIAAMDLSHIALPETFPEEPAIIFSTSGSTGKPKMVVHTNYNLACSPFSWIPNVDYESIDYNDRPFSWIGGSPVFHILLRRSRVFTSSALTTNGKNIDFLWKMIKEERCTDALFFPYIICDLLDLPQKSTDDGYRLNHIATGGQMIDNLYAKVMDTFCHHLVIVYGCTEIIGTTISRSLVKGETFISGEVGRPRPGVEVRIVDDQEHPVPIGTIGKVQMRGPSSMREYYGDMQLTATSFSTGSWFRSGDVGKISSNDSLIIVGRTKDVISRGGRKIYPGLIEHLIRHLRSLKYVCVVPVPDRRLHEEICVCFVRSDASEKTEDVKKFCEEHFYAESTVDGLGVMPAYYVQFKEFPLLSNGKPDKGAIRDEAIRSLRLSRD